MASSNVETEVTKEAAPIKFDVIGNLPAEIVQKIFLQLSPKDLRSATSCCSSWNAAVRCDYFWKKLCKREGYLEAEESTRSEFYNNFLKRYNYWEGVYWYNYRLQRNWETNNFKEFTYLIRGPNYDYASGLVLDDLFVIFNKKRTELYVFNWKSKEPISCLITTDNIFYPDCISKSGNYLIEFSSGLRLTVWDLQNGSRVFHNTVMHIFAIHTYKNLILLETCNEKFEVFNIETKKIEYEFEGILDNVDIMDGKIIYTTMDHVIHVLTWDDKSLVTLTCCNESEDHKLLVKNDLLLSFCKNEKNLDIVLCLWNLKTMTKLHSTLLRCSYDLRKATLTNTYLYLTIISSRGCFSYANDDIVHLWNYAKGTIAVSITNSNSTPRLTNDRFMIASCSSKIGMLCLKTGYFIDLCLPLAPSQLKGHMSETKFLYAKQNKQFISLHVRDFETGG